MFLASREGMWWVTYMLVAPTTQGQTGVIMGCWGVVLLQGWTEQTHWRFAAWLPAAQGEREWAHTNSSCVTPLVFCSLLDAEMADVKTHWCIRLQILSLPMYTWSNDIGRNTGPSKIVVTNLIYTEEYLAYQMNAFTMRALWIQEWGSKGWTKTPYNTTALQ